TGEVTVNRDTIGDYGKTVMPTDKVVFEKEKDGASKPQREVIPDTEKLKALQDASKRREGTGPGDSANPDWTRTFDRVQLRDLNEQFTQGFAKIKEPGSTLLPVGAVIANSTLDKFLEAKLKEPRPEGSKFEKPETIKPDPMQGKLDYKAMTLLPTVRYTVPLLLAVLLLWFAWRIVNLPAF